MVRSNSQIDQGEQLSNVVSLEDCQAACIADRTCIAVGWNPTAGPGQFCYIHDVNDTTAKPVVHDKTTLYYLNRGCSGQSFSSLFSERERYVLSPVRLSSVTLVRPT